MNKFINQLLKNEQGYGTVELLLIIAGLGLLATGIFKVLQSKLAGDGTTTSEANSATGKVTGGINSMIDSWTK